MNILYIIIILWSIIGAANFFDKIDDLPDTIIPKAVLCGGPLVWISFICAMVFLFLNFIYEYIKIKLE